MFMGLVVSDSVASNEITEPILGIPPQFQIILTSQSRYLGVEHTYNGV